jgi:two-component system chemotaxis response regulator CheY
MCPASTIGGKKFRSAENGGAFSMRVLVADDSSTMRKIIIRSLQAVGVTTAVEAADGNEAAALFKPGEFDLVLTDWNMPGKTGLELVQEIRSRDPNVPIIMITTEAEKGRVLQAIQAGVSDYIVKPFTADTLREKLEKHCGN